MAKTILIIAILFTALSFNSRVKERKFFIGYTGTVEDGRTYSGGEEFSVKEFPNVKEISSIIMREHSLKAVFIVSLYEFKNDEDSKRFWKP